MTASIASRSSAIDFRRERSTFIRINAVTIHFAFALTPLTPTTQATFSLIANPPGALARAGIVTRLTTGDRGSHPQHADQSDQEDRSERKEESPGNLECGEARENHRE